MSVEAVDLEAGSDEAATLLAELDMSVPVLHVVTATPTRIVTMRATYQGDDFVMAGGAVGGDTVTCLVGPAAALPGEIARLLQALGEAASVPLTPRFGAVHVLVPDALVLAQDVRAGALDDLTTALRVAALDTVPTWLADLAHGVSATFLTFVTGPSDTRMGTHLVGLPSGWGQLDDTDGRLSVGPKDFDQIQAELNEVTLLTAALVGEC